MKLIFLGTSHGYPEPNKRCSATMIEVGDRRYIVDMGTDITPDLINRGLSPECIKAIFITHMHGDHYGGLAQFLDFCDWRYTTSNFALCLPCEIESFRTAISAWVGLKINLHGEHSVIREYDYRRMTEGVFYDDGTLKVTAFRTLHTFESYSLLLEAEGKRVLMTGDLSSKVGPVADFPMSVIEKPCDLVVCEGAHFPATNYLPIFEGNNNVRHIWFNHYMEKRVGTIYELKEKLPDKEIVLAKDGMEVIV